MTLETWKNKGQYFNYKDHQIFTLEEGQGEVILLIHGFPTASWDWWQIWDKLASNYRVLALDMIGFGFSDKPRPYPYNIFDQADLFESFLASKGVESVKIISHDYGDSVAQELLARFNDRQKAGKSGLQIEAICFLNGGLFPETHHPLLIQKLLMSPIGGLLSKFLNRQKLGKNFKRIFGPNTQPTEAELDDFWALIAHNNGQGVAHLLIRYMQERKDNRERWVGAIMHTDVPLRLVNGLVDPVSGAHVVELYRKEMPNPDVVELENIGHFPLVEAPDQVLEAFLEFL